jgi:hypothetical protein
MPTYYVDGAVGNDGNLGTSEGAGNAWATIDHAMNNVIAGDKVWVKASATYNEMATVDTAGTLGNDIVFEGYTTTPGDNGKATINGTTHCLQDSIAGSMYYCFKNFILTGATSHGVDWASDDEYAFYNCEIINNGGYGINADRYGALVNCIVANNGSYGAWVTNESIFAGCVFYGNVNSSIRTGAYSVCYKCVFYGAPDSSSYYATEYPSTVLNCTIDGDNLLGRGVYFGSRMSAIMDNIIYDTSVAQHGVQATSCRAAHGYNLLESNVSDYIRDTGALIGLNDVTGDPAFTDEAGDDYTIGSSSPAKDVGVQPGGIT